MAAPAAAATALDELTTYRNQLAALNPSNAAPADRPTFALGQLNALLTLLSNVKAVPGPVGQPGWIGAYAMSLSAMADEWGQVQTNLVTAKNAVGATWTGAPATAAQSLINSMAGDITELSDAFRAAGRALDNWQETLGTVQYNDKNALADLDILVNDINHVKDEAWSGRELVSHSDTAFKAVALNLYGQTKPLWDRAEGIIDARISANQGNSHGVDDIVTALGALADHGTPTGPNAAPGALDLIDALTGTQTPGTPLGTAASDANTAATLILQSDNGKPLTPAQQAQLAAILGADDKDPQFATSLLNVLGPAAFLQFVGQPGNTSLIDPAAVTLATATNAAPGQPQLDPSWMDRLKQAEEANNGAGYQALGLLLAASNTDDAVNFNSAFLVKTGDDIIAYEKAHGGSGIWRTDIYGTNPSTGISGDTQVPAYDPVYDLMLALGANPPAANAFFSQNGSQVPGLAAKNYALVDYLLDRTWPEDQGSDPLAGSPGLSIPGSYLPIQTAQSHPGMTALGNALASGTMNTSDAGSRLLARYVIDDLGMPPRNGTFDSGLNQGITSMLVDYTATGDVTGSWSGFQGGFAEFDSSEALHNVLAAVAKDPTSNSQLLAAQMSNLGYTIKTWPSSSSPADAASYAGASGSIVKLLMDSQYSGTITDAITHDAQVNQNLSLVEAIANTVTGHFSDIPVVGSTLNDINGKIGDGVAIGAGAGILPNSKSFTDLVLDNLATNTTPGAQASAATTWNNTSDSLQQLINTATGQNPVFLKPSGSILGEDLGTPVRSAFLGALGINPASKTPPPTG